jgi:nucleotide-binding universal stress UspA family protein
MDPTHSAALDASPARTAGADACTSVSSFQRLLVPLDASPLGERALALAIDVAEACAADVELLRVLEHGTTAGELMDPLDWEDEQISATRYLQGIAARFADRNIRVHTRAVFGAPAEEILRVARQTGANLIVLSTHGSGQSTQWMLGSTVRKVVERACCSMLIVPALWERRAGAQYRTLVPIDASHRCRCVLPIAIRLTAHAGGALTLAHVVDDPILVSRTLPTDEEQELVDRLRGHNLALAREHLAELGRWVASDIDTVDVRAFASASPAMSLLDLAREVLADLVILSAHGHTSDGSCRFGSVAAQLIANPGCPTMVILDTESPESAPRWSGLFVSVRNGGVDASDSAPRV